MSEESQEVSYIALINSLSDRVQSSVKDFFTNGVVSSGIIIGGIFLASDQLVRVVELAISAFSNFVNNAKRR